MNAINIGDFWVLTLIGLPSLHGNMKLLKFFWFFLNLVFLFSLASFASTHLNDGPETGKGLWPNASSQWHCHPLLMDLCGWGRILIILAISNYISASAFHWILSHLLCGCAQPETWAGLWTDCALFGVCCTCGQLIQECTYSSCDCSLRVTEPMTVPAHHHQDPYVHRS